MLLSGPLGQGVARLTRDAQAQPPARLELADGKSYAAVDWQALAQQVFGQALPLDALPQWLRGAHAGWTGDQDQWRIVVTEASERKATAYPLRGTSGHAASLGRQHQLMPRALQISAEDVMVNIIVESWGDDDE